MESDLLPRVAGGDGKAMQACIGRYGGLVWSIALRMLRSRPDAEDAVQDIFIDLWRSAQRFDPARASERTYVAMIARRRIIDRRRRRAREDEVTTAEVDTQSVPSLDHVRMEASTEAALAVRAIRTLPADRQRVVRLAVYEGLTHQQISEQLGLPLGTVKSHVKRGLEAIRELLVADPPRRAEGVTP